ncbi:hypothetical protein [Nannocystis sp.]|uniref:hypothetical protein n=1 Tax=Nannocystis sp. TaxID=1962667 RepID=UPI0025CCD2A1|nr:hypothetical protein [Nannocystis sp.]MBK7830523.1 hypothetical protein [Nannocystis sp.]
MRHEGDEAGLTFGEGGVGLRLEGEAGQLAGGGAEVEGRGVLAGDAVGRVESVGLDGAADRVVGLALVDLAVAVGPLQRGDVEQGRALFGAWCWARCWA